MVPMIERHLRLKPYIKSALIDAGKIDMYMYTQRRNVFGVGNFYENNETNTEFAVKELSEDSTTFFTAEGIFLPGTRFSVNNIIEIQILLQNQTKFFFEHNKVNLTSSLLKDS
jgi:hypothetical protein